MLFCGRNLAGVDPIGRNAYVNIVELGTEIHDRCQNQVRPDRIICCLESFKLLGGLHEFSMDVGVDVREQPAIEHELCSPIPHSKLVGSSPNDLARVFVKGTPPGD